MKIEEGVGIKKGKGQGREGRGVEGWAKMMRS